MADVGLRKVTKKHAFNVKSPPDHVNGACLEAKLEHVLTQPKGSTLWDCMVLPPTRNAPIRLVVAICVDGAALTRAEALQTPIMKLISATFAKYEAILALCEVEQLSEEGEDESEVLFDLVPLPYLPFASPTFGFKGHAFLQSISLTLSFSTPPGRSPSHSGSSLDINDAAARVPVKELVSTTPLALSISDIVEQAMQKVIQGQMAKRWPWVYNGPFRENFKRDFDHYKSISSSLSNVLDEIDDGELRLLRRRDRAKALLQETQGAVAPKDAADAANADEGRSLQQLLFTTLCRLHEDLSKPGKLHLAHQAPAKTRGRDAESELELDLEAEAIIVDRPQQNPGEKFSDDSDFDDILAAGSLRDAEDEDVMLLDMRSDGPIADEDEAFVFNDAWSQSSGEGILDMDSD